MRMVEDMLRKEIERELEEISKMTPGTDEHRVACSSVQGLIDRAKELEEFGVKCQNEERNRKDDNDFKQKQFEADEKDKKTRNWLTAAGIVVPAGISVWGVLKSLKFEETGTITTLVGRNFFQKIFNVFKK